MLEEIILGSLAGLAFGFTIGYIKYLTLWRPLLKRPADSLKSTSVFLLRFTISFFINLVTLFVIYYFRNNLPWDFLYPIVGTALALSLSGRIFNINNRYTAKTIEEKCK